MVNNNHNPDKAAERVNTNISELTNALKELHDLEDRICQEDRNGEELSELGRLVTNVACCLLNIKGFARYMHSNEIFFVARCLHELPLEVHSNLEHLTDQYIAPQIRLTIEELAKLAQPPSRETLATTHTSNHVSLGT